MDSEKKAFTPLDDGALDEVTGGSGTVQEDGSVTYPCPSIDPWTMEKCPGTLVFAPGEPVTQCPVCGGSFRRMTSGLLCPVYDP